MHHKTKSILVIAILVLLVAGIGVLIGKGGMTGATTASTKIACYEDTDCNDDLSETEDLCRNPGTEYSLCVNKPRKE